MNADTVGKGDLALVFLGIVSRLKFLKCFNTYFGSRKSVVVLRPETGRGEAYEL
jgi:hypothetical protein